VAYATRGLLEIRTIGMAKIERVRKMLNKLRKA
jgi:hypothetical protein